MAAVLGENAKLYYNLDSTYGGTGTYASPDWDEICNVMELTLSLEQSEVEVTRRCSSGFRDYLQGLIDATITFKMLWDTGDAAFEDFQEAFFNKTVIEVAVMDGDVTTTGSEGLRSVCLVRSFSRSENIGEALTVDIALKPAENAYNSGAYVAPSWYEIP